MLCENDSYIPIRNSIHVPVAYMSKENPKFTLGHFTNERALKFKEVVGNN